MPPVMLISLNLIIQVNLFNHSKISHGLMEIYVIVLLRNFYKNITSKYSDLDTGAIKLYFNVKLLNLIL